MVALFAAAHAASAGPVSLLPDLNSPLHPSDSTPWTILLVLTLITLLPAILMCMTPLVRLLVVFHFLRQALGTQTAPSNPTLMGLALMMTWFLMTPVLAQVDQQAVEPYRQGQITGMDAIDRGIVPFIVQFGMYVSPVGFSSDVVPEKWRLLYSLNPVVGIIDGFRWSLMRGEMNLRVSAILVSMAVTSVFIVGGIWYFRKTEKTFADVI